MCGPAGCCGGRCCRATTSAFAPSAFASPDTGDASARPSVRAFARLGSIALTTRRAFSLTGLRCFISRLELPEEAGIGLRDLAVDPETRIGPAANPFTVVQIGPLGGAVARVGLVIAAARAHRTRPARRAVGLVRDVMRVEERRLFRAVDARVHVAKLVVVRSGEPVTQRDVAGRGHTE